MGIDYCAYVGPYLECKNEKIKKPCQIRSCVNAECKEHKREFHTKDIKFCTRCGSPIAEITIMKTENKVSQMEVQEEIKEDLHCAIRSGKFDVWIANKGREDRNARRFNLDYTEGAEEITHDMMAAEMTEFNDRYRHALSVIRKYYGLENVSVKWGIVKSIH